MRIAYIGMDFLISALYAVLEANCEIMEIFTCKTDNKTEFNTEVIRMAGELSVPCTISRVTLADFERLEAAGCQAVICAGYYHKVPTATKLPIVNVHPAYLPIGRGAWPMPVTILKELNYSGATLQRMTEQMDMGDIILQERFPVSADEDLKTIMVKMGTAIRHLILELMGNFDELYRNAFPQGEGEYWKNPGPEDWTVYPEMTFKEADKIFRAFYGFECLYKTKDRLYELIGGRITKDRPLAGSFFETEYGYITAESIEEIKQGNV